MTSVSIVYPADPAGTVPGGIDTFIRGIASHAPSDIEVRLVGMTTDPTARPVGRWTDCRFGARELRFFPVLAVAAAGSRSRIPLSVRFSVAVARHRAAVDGDILEFHRLEPALLFRGDARPKNAFIHQNMQALHNRKSDILWSRLPWLYFALEDRLLPTFDSVYVVVEAAVEWYRGRYPAQRERFRFTPTWVDPADFRAPSPAERSAARAEVCGEFGFPAGAEILVSVGRLDQQKDPLLLARSFQRLAAARPQAQLICIGDGVLRGELEGFVATAGLGARMHCAGLRSRQEIARLLWAADLFVLTSAYEGMPMSLLEALGSGVPAVSANVGEVRRILSSRNGAVVEERRPDAFADAMAATLDRCNRLRGGACLEAVAAYTPASVLAPVYENYRRLATLRSRAA